jgi:predicted O-methyltransferase YrrM
MNHIYQNIEGWFTFPNLYKQIVEKFSDNSHFVEIGTWLGKSASYMAVEIANSGKNIKFDCIDTWSGSEEHKNYTEIVTDSLYKNFLKNIEPVKKFINPIRTDSLKGAELYDNNSLDFVFIDASHDYENVKKDINAWYPKVKSGGILAGHDYHHTWEGVICAVDEFLKNQKYEKYIFSENCWGIIKR